MFQVHDIRDWHFAVLACGNAESAALNVQVEAAVGALSVFEAGTFFDTSSCPVENSDWLQRAGSECPSGCFCLWLPQAALAARLVLC